MGEKSVPTSDPKFMANAEVLARGLAQDPGRAGVSREASDAFSALVADFRAAMQAARSGGERSTTKTRAKNPARKRAADEYRRLTHLIRATRPDDVLLLTSLGLKERAKSAKPKPCPQEPPRLKFVRARHEGSGATPMHELEFRALDWSRKPPGAVRLELFVDLVPLDEPIPTHPGANHASRPWYLRSYTKSPIVLVPPLARVPMRVVYWGRWADSTGEVGPFSATVQGWVEGGSHQRLAPVFGSDRKPVQWIEDATGAAVARPAGRSEHYSVAVLEAQYESMHPQRIALPALPQPEPEQQEREPRRLEGPPPVEEAA